VICLYDSEWKIGSILEAIGERLILNNMKNMKKNVLVARDMEFGSIGESKHVLCMVQQGLEQWMAEYTYFDHKSLAILTNVDN